MKYTGDWLKLVFWDDVRNINLGLMPGLRIIRKGRLKPPLQQLRYCDSIFILGIKPHLVNAEQDLHSHRNPH
jgi:hypothetical protein